MKRPAKHMRVAAFTLAPDQFLGSLCSKLVPLCPVSRRRKKIPLMDPKGSGIAMENSWTTRSRCASANPPDSRTIVYISIVYVEVSTRSNRTEDTDLAPPTRIAITTIRGRIRSRSGIFGHSTAGLRRPRIYIATHASQKRRRTPCYLTCEER